MGKTKKHQQLILLDPGKAALLAALSKATRIPKQTLLREAVDDLLTKHSALIGVPTPREPTNVVPLKSKGKLAADRFFDEIAQSHGLQSFEQMTSQVEIYKTGKVSGKKSKSKRKS